MSRLVSELTNTTFRLTVKDKSYPVTFFNGITNDNREVIDN